MKKKYNIPACVVVQLDSRAALLQSVSGTATLDGTTFGGSSFDNSVIEANTKVISDKNVWDDEW